MDIQTESAALLSRPGVRHAGLPQMNMPWFESPFFEPLLAEQNFSPEEVRQLRFFAEHGYLILDSLFPDIDMRAKRIIRALEPCYQGRPRLQDEWKNNDDIKALAVDRSILRILKMLYQREPIPFQTINFPVGTEQHTHSDTVHFHSVPHRFMCGVWIALEDIDLPSGPLHIYPGSHRLPVWNFHDLGLPSGHDQYHIYEEGIEHFVKALGLQKEKVLLKKGQTLIWAANLLHGGEPILDPARTRQSQVTHYYFADCLYYTPMLSDPYIGKVQLRRITNIRTGETVPNIYNGKNIDAADVTASVASGMMMQPLKRNMRSKVKHAAKRALSKLF